jgi:lincosamide nucleotidyltransferase A/C/D/E
MRPDMPASALVDLLQAFDNAGIQLWLDGGWAVDAVLAEQTRPHKDVDVIVRRADLSRLQQILDRRGYARQEGGTYANFVLADGVGHEIDVHVIDRDRQGNGVYRLEDGSDWIFPAQGFTGRGIVGGMAVRCLTPEVQVLCHAHGYVPTEKDLRDMEQLQKRFGVELPPHLQRQC